MKPRYIVAGDRNSWRVIDTKRAFRRVAGPYSWETANRVAAAMNAETRR